MDDTTPIFTFRMAQDDYEHFIQTFPGAADFLREARSRAEAEMVRRTASWGMLTPAHGHHIVVPERSQS